MTEKIPVARSLDFQSKEVRFQYIKLDKKLYLKSLKLEVKEHARI